MTRYFETFFAFKIYEYSKLFSCCNVIFCNGMYIDVLVQKHPISFSYSLWNTVVYFVFINVLFCFCIIYSLVWISINNWFICNCNDLTFYVNVQLQSSNGIALQLVQIDEFLSCFGNLLLVSQTIFKFYHINFIFLLHFMTALYQHTDGISTYCSH